jgi:hypothetical protein
VSKYEYIDPHKSALTNRNSVVKICLWLAVSTSGCYRWAIRPQSATAAWRTGVCWDNSRAESFFSMLNNERVYCTAYATKSQARSDVIRCIDRFYNSRSRHTALGYRRPNEVHHGYQQAALAA